MRDKRLRIGVSALVVRPGSTLTHENYLFNLVREFATLTNGVRLFVTPQSAPIFMRLADAGVELRVAPRWVGRAVALRVLFEQMGLPAWARRERVDVLFIPSTIGPALPGQPMVVAIRYDLEPGHMKSVSRWRQAYFRALFRLSCRAAAKLLTPTESFKTRLVSRWGLPEDKVVVVHHGVQTPAIDGAASEAQLREQYGLSGPFVLSVTSSMPHKNLRGAIEAYAILKHRGHPDLRLVLVGPVERPDLERQLAEVGARHPVRATDVLYVGPVPNTAVHAFYAQAMLLLYLSYAESFSNTVVEALAWGLPVIASDIPAHREVLGDAGVLVNVDNPLEAAEACDQVLRDDALRGRLAANAKHRAQNFTWNATARRMLDVFESVAC